MRSRAAGRRLSPPKPRMRRATYVENPTRGCSPSLPMSMPASSCLPTTASAAVPRASSVSSTGSPRSCRMRSSRSRGGRGKLPTCVTRIRPSLRCTPPTPALDSSFRPRRRARRPVASDPEAPDRPGDEPQSVALEENGDLAVPGDDRLAAAPGDGADDLPCCRRRRHDETLGQRLARLRVPDAAVVHLADLALDETRADERDRDAVRVELVAERLGEGADGELAHRVGAPARDGDVAAHAATMTR